MDLISRSTFCSVLRRLLSAGQFVTLQELEDHGALFLDGEFHMGEGGPGRQRRVESAGKRLYCLPPSVLEDNGGGLAAVFRRLGDHPRRRSFR